MRLHRPLLAALVLLAGAGRLDAQAAIRPMASSRATTSVELGYPRDSAPPGAQPQHIRLDYGQPHLRGRALHTDSLVPYDQPWRTGANAPTSFSTDVDLVLGGQRVAKGTYVVWTIPARSGWTLVLQRGDRPEALERVMPYDRQFDVARIALRRTTLTAPVESLTMWLVPSTTPGARRGELRMAWGTTMHTTDWTLP
jgi:hypothetical protein